MIKIQTATEKIKGKGGIILAGKIAVKAGLGKIKSSPVKNARAVIAMLFGIMAEGKKRLRKYRGETGKPVIPDGNGARHCVRERNRQAVY